MDIEQIIEESVVELVGGREGLNDFIERQVQKHWQKVHFIPIKYRILGGFLQSLNIKFGNFIEVLIAKVVDADPKFEVIKDISRRKIALELDEECERLIDEHINLPLKGEAIIQQLPAKLNKLYSDIFTFQNLGEKFNKRILDVDTLFTTITPGQYYYLEIKYNDDHDTGKFTDINRKLLKTYAGLVHKLGVQKKEDFHPFLFYFNYYRRYYPSPYLREGIEILRGEELFDKFDFSITYKEIGNKLGEIEEKLEGLFDEYRERIFARVRELKETNFKQKGLPL